MGYFEEKQREEKEEEKKRRKDNSRLSGYLVAGVNDADAELLRSNKNRADVAADQRENKLNAVI